MFRRTQDTPKVNGSFVYGAITLYRQPSQIVRLPLLNPLLKSYYPSLKEVWALPVSLAATQGIEFSFSSYSY